MILYTPTCFVVHLQVCPIKVISISCNSKKVIYCAFKATDAVLLSTYGQA